MPRLKPLALAMFSLFTVAGCMTVNSPSAHSPMRIEAASRVEHGGMKLKAQDHHRIGKELSGQGQHEKAIAAYIEALVLNSRFVDAHNALGVSYARLGRYEDAIRSIQTAIALAPKSAYLHNNLGYAYLLQESNGKAESALEEATRLDPSHESAMINLLVARQRLGKPLLLPQAKKTAPSEQSQQLMGEEIVGTPLPAPVLEQPPTPKKRPEHTFRTPEAKLVAIAPNVYELRIPEAPSSTSMAMAPKALPAPSPVPAAMMEVSSKRVRVEVSNGGGIRGMARRVAQFLSGNDQIAQRITNQRPFNQATTQIEYRAGYRADAERIGGSFPRQVALAESQSLNRDVEVRVVLGKDVNHRTALLIPGETRIRLAANNI